MDGSTITSTPAVLEQEVTSLLQQGVPFTELQLAVIAALQTHHCTLVGVWAYEGKVEIHYWPAGCSIGQLVTILAPTSYTRAHQDSGW